MRTRRGTRLPWYRLLVMTLAAVVTMALVPATASAQAGEPDGDFTLTLNASDLGVSVNQGALRAEVAKYQGTRLSDAGKREVEAYSLGNLNEDVAHWQDFDGTLSVTPDGSGVTVTIPRAEVQTTANWWQSALATAGGLLAGVLATVACGAAFPVGGALCGAIGGFVTGFITGILTQVADGSLQDAGAWATTIAVALVSAIPGGSIGAAVSAWTETTLPALFTKMGAWLLAKAKTTWLVWLGGGAFMEAASAFVIRVSQRLPTAFQAAGHPDAPASDRSCDVYEFYGTPCAAAYSTARALYPGYGGPLYQVQRASDGAKSDVGLLTPGGYADAGHQDSFCANTSCLITKLYDQSPEWNDLTVAPDGTAGHGDHAADAKSLPMKVAGHSVYGVNITGQSGYRNNRTRGIAVADQPEGMYMVTSGTHVNDGCCFDFGNAETNNTDPGNGHMDAVNFGTNCYFPPCSGQGPWVAGDLENGLFQGANGSNTANRGNPGNFITALLKNDGKTTYALKGGNAQSGGLTTWWDGALPDRGGYRPMQKEGAIILGIGGDNSNASIGSFFEGAMTQGYPTDTADDQAQKGIVNAGYSGSSGGNPGGGSTATAIATGQSVVHDGYTSTFTVDAANGHLQESFLPKMFDPWHTQDLSANYGTPPVKPGTVPVSVVHDGYTSVYTVDALNGHLQETYLPRMGDPWSTQDLSVNYGSPATNWTATAVVHDGYTSVYTVDGANGHLRETYLPKMGGPWYNQDLSANYGSPQVQAGTSPVSIVHDGYTSVYTIAPDHHLHETYLPKMGGPWYAQDLSNNYGTPPSSITPTAAVHTGYTSLYTVDDGSHHLQETYLPKMGDPWHTQDLSANYGTPQVAAGTQPVALNHTGYTSVYTVDWISNHLQETYLPKMGDPWHTQDLSNTYGTPQTTESPIPLLHPDPAGELTWSSVFTINQFTNHLQETYLRAIGDPWDTQDISAKYGTPPDAATDLPTAGWSVVHDGYTSTFTGDRGSGHLQESYLPKMGDPWHTQDLSKNYGTPDIAALTVPVAVTHSGYTSVFTVDDESGHLQETYLPKIGDPWVTQDLSKNYGTPATDRTPTVVFHNGYTSVYTVDASNGHLDETYLPKMGDAWTTQDLSRNYGTPVVRPNSLLSAIVHSGWTSVYSVDAGSNHLQETYLPAVGDPWTTQDLSNNYGTPAVGGFSSPSAIVHSGWTSVYTINTDNDLEETYLPAIGDRWTAQDLSQNYGTPKAAAVTPVALYHTGFTSVYTVDVRDGHLDETYLPAIGDRWTTQDLTQNYGVPIPSLDPAGPVAALVHYDTSGGLTWTSLFSVDAGKDNHLQESYLPVIGGPWTTQDLSDKYGTPPV